MIPCMQCQKGMTLYHNLGTKEQNQLLFTVTDVYITDITCPNLQGL